VQTYVSPSLINFLEELDAELLKAFQGATSTSLEYLQRLRDENLLLNLCDKIEDFISKFASDDKVSRLSLVKLDHLYYKHDTIYERMKAKASREDKENIYILSQPSQEVIADLAGKVSKHGS